MGLPSVAVLPSRGDATPVACPPISLPSPRSPALPPTQTVKRKSHTPASSTPQASASAPPHTAGIEKSTLTTSSDQAAQKLPEDPSQQPEVPTLRRGTDDSAVRQFLEGLAQPSVELLPLFITHGVSSASSLRALGRVAAEHREVFLRRDLSLNSFQICLVSDGLRRLTQ